VLPVILRVWSKLRLSKVPGSSDVRPVLERSRVASFVVKLNTPAGSDVRPALLLRSSVWSAAKRSNTPSRSDVRPVL
jgi:hypothetical protein